jgi:hypothetical protein
MLQNELEFQIKVDIQFNQIQHQPQLMKMRLKVVMKEVTIKN